MGTGTIKHESAPEAQPLNSFSRNLSPRQRELGVIHQADWRLILLKDFPAADPRAKEPIAGVPWTRYRPPLDVLCSHPGRLGFQPSSGHMTALDIDRGDHRRIHGAYVECPSRRPGGVHKYFDEDLRFKDRPWSAEGCGGEIRHKGYLVLWGKAVHRMAKALQEARQLSLFPFPADLIREVVQGEAELHVPGREKRAAPVPRSLWHPGMELERVQVGARYVALFWHLRKWAYKQTRGLDLGDWKARVLDECYAMNELFPKPFRGNEVRQVKDTSYSVAVWTWKTLLDYGRYRTPEMQAARGSASGASRRKGSIEQLRPWEAEGISRATWHRDRGRSEPKDTHGGARNFK